MKKENKEKSEKNSHSKKHDIFAEFWEESWVYIKTVVDALREPVLILNKDLKIIAANEAFYSLFQVKKVDTEGKLIYKLGNGQWDIPKLRSLLEEILPKETFFKGFEVKHIFPSIGQKTIILNAQHIYSKNPKTAEIFPSLIMLAMDDITGLITMAETFTEHTNQLEQTITTRTSNLEEKVIKLEKKFNVLSKK
jgi:PAS domain-containing protein